jgi:hypothetical protein
MAYVEGELNLNGYGSNNGGMWGQDGIWAILLLALLGNRGFGFGGGYGGGSGAVAGDLYGYQLGKLATTNDVASGFSTSEIMSDLNSILLSNAQGFAGINSAIANSTSTLGYNMLQGFHGVDNAVCTLGYNMATGFNTLGHQISDCCCGVKSAIADLKYSNEAQTCQILTNQTAQTQRIIDYLTNEKIEGLRAENVALKGRISNDAQSAYILERLSPCPKPAYYVPNPNCCYSPCGATTNTIIQ